MTREPSRPCRPSRVTYGPWIGLDTPGLVKIRNPVHDNMGKISTPSTPNFSNSGDMFRKWIHLFIRKDSVPNPRRYVSLVLRPDYEITGIPLSMGFIDGLYLSVVIQIPFPVTLCFMAWTKDQNTNDVIDLILSWIFDKWLTCLFTTIQPVREETVVKELDPPEI